MNVQELRIGNIITGIYDSDDGDELSCECKVVALDSTGSLMDYKIWVDGKSNSEVYNDFTPTPLTEEYLLKWGFVKVGRNYVKDWLLLHTNNKTGTVDFLLNEPDGGRYKVTVLKYAHQLQNLYFTLTGKELP